MSAGYLEKSDLWRLTVAYWPEASKAGVQPVIVQGYPREEEWLPNYYHPTDIDFAHPPSRADFLQVVRQTPWMHVWESGLLPAVSRNPWPLMQLGNDGSSQDLWDFVEGNPEKLRVGRLSVNRHHSYCNGGSGYVPALFSDEQEVLKRLRKEKRRGAQEIIHEHRNAILEESESRGGGYQVRGTIIRRLLKEHL